MNGLRFDRRRGLERPKMKMLKHARFLEITSGHRGRFAIVILAVLGMTLSGAARGQNFNEFALPTGTSDAYGIAAGPDGNLWFTEFGATGSGGSPRPAHHRVRDPHSRQQPLAVSRPDRTATSGSPKTVPTRSDGSPPPGSSPSSRSRRPAAVPIGIAAGPDGNLWFTEYSWQQDRADHDRRGHHRVPDPHGQQRPYGIAAGPDGNLWFTEDSGQQDRADHDRRRHHRVRRSPRPAANRHTA